MNKDNTLRKLANILTLKAVGAENALSSGKIADALGIKDKGETRTGTRKLVRELISSGMPIGSNRKGYYLIDDDEELISYLDELYNRVSAIQTRAQEVHNNYIRSYPRCYRKNEVKGTDSITNVMALVTDPYSSCGSK